ncbi:MAG: cobalamin-binding protein [Candidatus Cloacimonetes bacterium]|nr:cobalamin-binding protein [Candidatus Cloacimonadota bacterium]
MRFLLDSGSDAGLDGRKRDFERGLVRKLSVLIILALLLGACGPASQSKGGYVVLSPEVAEILCAIGAEEQISGVTAECDYPPSLASKYPVGNFSTVNKEAILAMKPELVFCSALEQEGIAGELKKLGLKVIEVYPKSLGALLNEINRLGKLTGHAAEAAQLRTSMETAIKDIKTSNTGKARPKVYLEIYRDPLMSVADSSLVGELIETAGGDNIFPTLERDYARVSAEAIIKAAPDIMICYSQDTLANIRTRKGWQDIPAIKTGHIYFEDSISPDLIQRATPRSIEGMKALQTAFSTWREGR